MRRKKLVRSFPLPIPLIIFFLVMGIVLLVLVTTGQNRSILSVRVPLPTPTPSRVPFAKTVNFTFGSLPLSIIAVPVEATASISLIPNFSQKQFPEEVASASACTSAINGGFYKGNRTPLGLFYSQGIMAGKAVKSSVANGFFAQNKFNQRSIVSYPPDFLEGYDFVLQSGPIFTVTSKRSSYVRDEHARRSLLGMDAQNIVYLISVRGSESAYSGPYLADIPAIFARKEVQNVIPVTIVLNLDGGGASFFYSSDGVDTYLLPALSPVGSVICVKK